MPVVSDFTHIVNDGPDSADDVVIGDGTPNGFTRDFDTGGRHAAGTAFITFMVRGMTVTNEDAQLELNDEPLGKLFNNNGGNRHHWQTQTVSMAGSKLKNGKNTLRVHTVDNPPGHPAADGQKDAFAIRNVICHFKQDV